jgi:hypothetical protein
MAAEADDADLPPNEPPSIFSGVEIAPRMALLSADAMTGPNETVDPFSSTRNGTVSLISPEGSLSRAIVRSIGTPNILVNEFGSRSEMPNLFNTRSLSICMRDPCVFSFVVTEI